MSHITDAINYSQRTAVHMERCAGVPHTIETCTRLNMVERLAIVQSTNERYA